MFFANRPDRDVGTIPTADAIDAFNTDEVPPNAALVGQVGDGTEEIVVVEILSGEVAPDTGALTYQVIVLGDASELGMELEGAPVTAVAEAREHVSISFFIDDWCVISRWPAPIIMPAPPEGCGGLPTIPS